MEIFSKLNFNSFMEFIPSYHFVEQNCHLFPKKSRFRLNYWFYTLNKRSNAWIKEVKFSLALKGI